MIRTSFIATIEKSIVPHAKEKSRVPYDISGAHASSSHVPSSPQERLWRPCPCNAREHNLRERKGKANSSFLHPHRSILVESIERVVLVPRITLCNSRIIPVLFRLRASVITISIALVVA